MSDAKEITNKRILAKKLVDNFAKLEFINCNIFNSLNIEVINEANEKIVITQSEIVDELVDKTRELIYSEIKKHTEEFNAKENNEAERS